MKQFVFAFNIKCNANSTKMTILYKISWKHRWPQFNHYWMVRPSPPLPHLFITEWRELRLVSAELSVESMDCGFECSGVILQVLQLFLHHSCLRVRHVIWNTRGTMSHQNTSPADQRMLAICTSSCTLVLPFLKCQSQCGEGNTAM